VLTLRLLRALSVPNVLAHPARTLVTIVGVALGVAAFLGIANVNGWVVASFEDSLTTIAGESQLEIDPTAGTLAEDAIARVAEAPGVRAAAGMLETFIPLVDGPAESLYLLGIDFLGSPVWRAQFPRDALDIPDELVFISRPDSVVVTRAFAARRALHLGDSIRVVAPDGERTLQVRGLLDDVSTARLFGGAVAIMDLPAAMRLLRREGAVDRILVTLSDDTDRDVVRERLAATLGPAVEVTTPEGRGEQAEKLLASLRVMLATASFLALVVGGFIVYHTVAVAVSQRRRQFALANAVGIPRQVLRRVCMLETLGLAAVGVVGGLALGHALGALVAPLVGTAASEIWLRVDAAQHAQSLRDVVIASAMGVAAALVAGVLAIRLTFRAPTVEALRPVGAATGDEDVRRWMIPIGITGVAGGVALAALPPGVPASVVIAAVDGVDAAGIVGAACLAPALVLGAGWLLHRATSSTRRLPLRLAAIHLARAPARSGATVATIAAALGIASALAILVESFQGAYLQWVEQHFAADLFVGSGGRVRLLAGPPIGPGVTDVIRSIDGVASVEPFRVIRIRLGDRTVFLQGISVADRLARGGLPMVEGTLEAAAADLENGTAVLLSDNLAYRLQLHAGDRLELPTPTGPLAVRVAGTFVDFLGSLDLGAVAVADGVLRSRWHDDAANLLRVWLVPGTTVAAVRQRVMEQLGVGYFVLTGRDFVDGVRGVLGRFFRVAWLLIVVSTFIGAIGIVNTQVAAMLDRTRANAMLHTIGIPVRAIARSVLLECGFLGALGAGIGVAVGTVLGADLMTWSIRLLTGWRIPLRLPYGQLVVGVVAAAMMSAVAGYVPARAATRLSTGTRSVD